MEEGDGKGNRCNEKKIKGARVGTPLDTDRPPKLPRSEDGRLDGAGWLRRWIRRAAADVAGVGQPGLRPAALRVGGRVTGSKGKGAARSA